MHEFTRAYDGVKKNNKNKPQKIYSKERNPFVLCPKINKESRRTKKLSKLSKTDQLCNSSYFR